MDGNRTMKQVLRAWLATALLVWQARHEWFFVRKTTKNATSPHGGATMLKAWQARTAWQASLPRHRRGGHLAPSADVEEPAAPRAAFTIIELLIVISIIAILIGFALPSYLGTKDTARRRQAIITAKHLELAFNEYYNQNQSWPPKDSGDLVKGSVLSALTSYNGVVYFDIGTNTKDTFKDPWGGYYQVVFDIDFDNKVTTPDGASIAKSVIVWSVASNAAGQVITNKSWE